MVYTRFEELNFDEDELVIETLEFFEEVVDKCESVVVGSFGHVKGYETGFEVLTQEASSFGSCPFDT